MRAELDKRILIVEDDEKSARFLREALEIYGYNVTVADNGKSGLQIYEADPFPLIISDLEMPVMGGRELISRLVTVNTPPVVIVQTAHNEVSMVTDIMRLGVYDYLVKPVNINDLILKVKGAFESFYLR
jgi:DNA-binding NtrC family response regulator